MALTAAQKRLVRTTLLHFEPMHNEVSKILFNTDDEFLRYFGNCPDKLCQITFACMMYHRFQAYNKHRFAKSQVKERQTAELMWADIEAEVKTETAKTVQDLYQDITDYLGEEWQIDVTTEDLDKADAFVGRRRRTRKEVSETCKDQDKS